jgi:hypothetical protein
LLVEKNNTDWEGLALCLKIVVLLVQMLLAVVADQRKMW